MNARNEAPPAADTAVFSAEAEQSVLGCLLLDNGSLVRVSNLIREEHFYRADHRLIFQHIAKLITSGDPADVITVLEALQASGGVVKAGGLAYLNALVQNTPSAANVLRYAEIVVERARRRELLSTAESIRSTALNPNGATAAVLIEQARTALDRIRVEGADAPDTRKRTRASVILSRASDIAPEAIYWLWQNWVPAGKLSILAGQPGCGKTTIALSIAATVSRGGDWPDGTKCAEPRNVLIWTGEDGLADTLVPRLHAAGADCTRIWFVESVEGEDGKLLPFDPSRDVPILSEKIQEMGGAGLLIVDPIISVVNGDGHKSIDVRKSLQPLLDLGAAHDCAIFGITHFSKGSKASAPIDRILGSQAFGAAARMILIAGKDESSDRRILAKSKCNIAVESGAFEYTIEVVDGDGIPSSRVAWGEPVEGSARDILREIEADDVDGEDDAQVRASKFERVRCMLYEWLRPFMSTKEMKAAAAAEGISWRTVERAKDAEIETGAKIRAVKQGKDWGWIWDNYEANHSDVAVKSTPPLSLISSPPRIQLRQTDGGVESLDQQGLAGKSATPPSFAEPPRAHARTHARAHVPSGGVDFLADLTANASPASESTPPSTPPSEIHGGVELEAGGVDVDAEETGI
ncbi:AAA family ATPase [Paraburkholderia phytofirmans]|uniref:AAA family ATPase n=1 Tax=Paraburkholderia phytofirmans TaxID=261302 RepID=UPI0038B8FF07